MQYCNAENNRVRWWDLHLFKLIFEKINLKEIKYKMIDETPLRLELLSLHVRELMQLFDCKDAKKCNLIELFHR